MYNKKILCWSWKILVCSIELTEVKIDMENRTHELQVQIQELKGKLETLCKALSKVFQPTYMDN